VYPAGLRLNALSLKLAAAGSVLSAFALRRLSAADAAALSALAVSAATLALARVRGRRIPLADARVALVGIADGVGGICLFAGLERLGPVPVAFLGALSPVFAAPLAFLVLGERLAPRQTVLAAAAVAGALGFTWHGGGPLDLGGIAYASASTFAFAAGNLASKLALRRRDEVELLAGSRLVSLAVVLAWGATAGRLGRGPLDPLGAGLAVASALVGNVASVLLLYRALRRASLSMTSVVRAAGPVASAACAWPFFPVALSPANVAGGALLLASVAWLGIGARHRRAPAPGDQAARSDPGDADPARARRAGKAGWAGAISARRSASSRAWDRSWPRIILGRSPSATFPTPSCLPERSQARGGSARRRARLAARARWKRRAPARASRTS
jgi:probable blue pigment (indigoidine) exporter